MKDSGSLALNGARLGLGQGTLREPHARNHTATHSINLINDSLYIMRVGLPCGPCSGTVSLLLHLEIKEGFQHIKLSSGYFVVTRAL